MKTYLVLPYQCVETPDTHEEMRQYWYKAILPKSIAEKNKLWCGMTYQDLLLSLDSEYDVISTSGKTISRRLISENDRKIIDNYHELSQIAYLEDDTVDFLGYKSKKIKDLKLIEPKNDGGYYLFIDKRIVDSSYKHIGIDMTYIKQICQELYDKEYISEITFSYDGKLFDMFAIYNNEDVYVVENFEFITSNKNNDIYLSFIKFNKVFDKNEANDVLRLLSKIMSITQLQIINVELQDLYELN